MIEDQGDNNHSESLWTVYQENELLKQRVQQLEKEVELWKERARWLATLGR